MDFENSKQSERRLTCLPNEIKISIGYKILTMTKKCNLLVSLTMYVNTNAENKCERHNTYRLTLNCEKENPAKCKTKQKVKKTMQSNTGY